MSSSTDHIPLRLVNAWILAALAVACLAGAGLLRQQQRQAEPREAWSELYRDTPAARCLARGIERFEQSGEWPATREGRSARALIDLACGEDLAAFGPDAAQAQPASLALGG